MLLNVFFNRKVASSFIQGLQELQKGLMHLPRRKEAGDRKNFTRISEEGEHP